MRTRSFLFLFAALFSLAACGSSGQQSADTATDAVADGAMPADVQAETGTPPVDWDAVFTRTDWQDDGKRRLVILHTNDLHSHHNGTGPLADYTPESPRDDGTVGGFARLATLIERQRRDLRPGADLLVLDAGDFTFGSAFSALAPTLSTELQFMEAAGFTATTIGNHELDWTPEGIAAVLDTGVSSDSTLRVLASNLLFDDDDPADDDLAALMDEKVHRYHVVEAANGLRIGIFGILGKGAFSLAPKAAPVTLRPPVEAAKEMVATLRDTEGVDLVICLSHSGVGEPGETGEDEKLAEAVDGIDLIVGGHTHTLMPEPKVVNGTIILQAGSYGAYLGHLVLVETDQGFASEGWEPLPVTDDVPGLPDIATLVAQWELLLDDALFAGFEHGYRDAIAHIPFDLPQVEMAESALGNFVTDAIRYSTGLHTSPIDVALEANGVIREGIRKGGLGTLLFGDVLRILPTGIGAGLSLGYPMCDFHLTAQEVTAGIAPMVSDSFFVQASGMRFEYDPDGKLLEQVTATYLGNDVDGYAAEPLDLSPENDTLYHVAANLYLAEMLGVLKELTGGLLAIEPKDADGTVIGDIHDMVIDLDPAAAGVQELKVWRTLYEYLLSLPADEASGLPSVPGRYSAPAGRIHAQ